MNGSKELSLVSLIASALFSLSACSGELAPTNDDSEEQAAKGDSSGDVAEGSRLDLNLPNDMKDEEDDFVPVKDWNHYDDMDGEFGDGFVSLTCDGEKISEKGDFKGSVKGVFEVIVYQQEPAATQGSDEEEKTEETAKFEEADKSERISDEDFQKEQPAVVDEPQKVKIARVVFPYTCESNSFVSLAVDADKTYHVTVNLMTADLELRYTGSSFVDGADDGLIPLIMEKVDGKKQRTVDLEVLFQGDK